MSQIDKLLINLNERQREAVRTTQGPLLVLAGAGSGKTKTLVHRLAYLILEEKVSPASILAVTFTNRAAKEMRERVATLMRRKTDLPTLGTFHSISCRFLRHEAPKFSYPSHFSIFADDEQKGLIKQVVRELGIPSKRLSLGAVSGAISRAKSSLLTPADFESTAEDWFSETVARIYPRYQDLLKINRAFDFDDLIGKMVELWKSDEGILKRYHKQFKYILVDEYQDVNTAQYQWTSLLAKVSRNLCVVGDDWQSIYSWRGADFGNILRFHEDYPDAKIIKLEQNYRSTKIIIGASNAIMSKARVKADKTLWTTNETGEPIKIVEVEDEVMEAKFITDEVLRLVSNEKDELIYQPEPSSFLPDVAPWRRFYGNSSELKEFAVLYRTNAQSRALEEACLKAGLPYHLVGGIKFYERREIKDMLAYLRFLLNPHDAMSFERACLHPARGLGMTTVDALILQAQKEKKDILTLSEQDVGLKGARAESLTNLVALFRRAQEALPKQTVSEIIDLLLAQSGLQAELNDGTSEGETRLQNIYELKTVAQERAPGKGAEALEKFLTDVSLWQDQDDDKASGITLMTLHAAKGLEFDTVFVVGLEEGLFPHTSSMNDPRELEEERRLAYVGLTRARKKLYCLYAANRRIFGSVQMGIPSRFIVELPEEFIESITLTTV